MYKWILAFLCLTGLALAEFGASTDGKLAIVTFEDKDYKQLDSVQCYFFINDDGPATDTVTLYPSPTLYYFCFKDSVDFSHVGNYMVLCGYYRHEDAPALTAWTMGGWENKAAPASGNGFNQLVLYVVDESDSALDNARIKISGGGANYTGITGTAGSDTFNLDDGSWEVRVYHTTYQQDTIPQTITLSAADLVDTIPMTSVSTASGFVTLYVDASSFGGSIIQGAKLLVTPNMAVTDSSDTFRPVSTLTATTDSTGYAAVTVLRSSQKKYPTGGKLRYTISLEKQPYNTRTVSNVSAPDSSSYRITF